MKTGMIVLASIALIGFGGHAMAQTLDYGRDLTNYGAGGALTSPNANTPYDNLRNGSAGQDATPQGYDTTQGHNGSPSSNDGTRTGGNPGNHWTAYGGTNRGKTGGACPGYAFMAYCR